MIKKRIDGDINKDLFVTPEVLSIVYSDVLIILIVEKILEKKIIIGIISYSSEGKLYKLN
tara:strand:- start:3 stop:182 length:180 start_codon:yes stop_codon:yes gene_type:complete